MANIVSKLEVYKRIFPKSHMSRPHVETNYNDDALSNQRGSSEKNIFLIGSATDGNPNEVYELNTLQAVKGIFGSGDLVDAAEVVWNPTNSGIQRGGTIYAMRAEDAKPSTLDKGKFQFKSKVYGDNANQIFLTYDKDAISGAPRLNVNYPVKNYNVTYTGIGNVFDIAYTGKESFAQVSVEATDDSKEAGKVVVRVGKDKDNLTDLVSYDLTLNSYEKLYQVIDGLQSLPGFSVRANSSSTSIDSRYLDIQTVDLPSQASVISSTAPGGFDVTVKESQLEYQHVTSVAGDLSAKIRNDQFLAVSIDTQADYPDEFSQTPMSGGETGSVPVSWADKFKNILGSNVYYVVPLTSKENIHAELKEFINEQNIFGYNYRGFVGGGFDESDNDAISRRIALNSDRIALVANSGHYTSLNGTKRHIPGYIMAAYLAGVASSLAIGKSITNKYLDLVDLDQNFAGETLDRLDANGVIAIEHVVNRNATGGHKIVEGITTSNSTNEPVKSLISLGELTDFLFDDLRLYLDENYIGANVTISSADLIKSNVVTFLQREVEAGLIVTFNERDVSVDIDGQNAYIVFAVDPSQEIRNVIVQGAYNRYQASTSDDNE